MTDVTKLQEILAAVASDVTSLLAAESVPLGAASPPSTSGVYLLLVDGDVKYVGEAKGNGGLRDRLLSKHLSGDESHAIQRAYRVEFPDRLLRREHIRSTVCAKWLEISDRDRVSAVERILICMYKPIWNKR